MQMRTAADEFGHPVYGLLGLHAGEGVLNVAGGRPCSQMTLLYPAGIGAFDAAGASESPETNPLRFEAPTRRGGPSRGGQ